MERTTNDPFQPSHESQSNMIRIVLTLFVLFATLTLNAQMTQFTDNVIIV